MALRTTILVALAAVVVAQNAQQPPHGAYLEQDGLVAIEIESHDDGPVANWEYGNTLTGSDGSSYSGDGYYIWKHNSAIVGKGQGQTWAHFSSFVYFSIGITAK